MPQEALMITVGRASSMRVASSRAAKPPKTTEWTAPSLAQASMAVAASGTIGIEITTRSPLPTPSDTNAPASWATSCCSSA